jgi:glutamate formiminotransferase/formiminotetrahydrofolate cyclodeaminase
MGTSSDSSEPLAPLLAELAAPTPSPGAGSAAGWAAALAAGLAEMSAGLTRTAASGVLAERAAHLRAQALELALRDRTSFAGVLEARRAGRDDADALAAAAGVPVALAALGAELAELGAQLAATGNPALEGDATTAALLAEAATRAAARLVELNLAHDPAHEHHASVAIHVERATAARDAVLRRDGRA